MLNSESNRLIKPDYCLLALQFRSENQKGKFCMQLISVVYSRKIIIICQRVRGSYKWCNNYALICINKVLKSASKDVGAASAGARTPHPALDNPHD